MGQFNARAGLVRQSPLGEPNGVAAWATYRQAVRARATGADKISAVLPTQAAYVQGSRPT